MSDCRSRVPDRLRDLHLLLLLVPQPHDSALCERPLRCHSDGAQLCPPIRNLLDQVKTYFMNIIVARTNNSID